MNTLRLRLSALALFGILLAAACAPLAPAPTAAPTALLSPTVTALPSPASTALVGPTKTTISSKLFRIPLSVTYDSNWMTGHGYPTWMELTYRPATLYLDFLEVDDTTLYVPGDPPTRVSFPDDFTGYVKSNAWFSDVTAPVSISVGGVNGTDFYAVAATPGQLRVPFLSQNTAPVKEWVYPQAQKFRFVYFPDISGKRLLIVAGNEFDMNNGHGPLPIAQFDAIMPEVQKVLNTLTFAR